MRFGPHLSSGCGPFSCAAPTVPGLLSRRTRVAAVVPDARGRRGAGRAGRPSRPVICRAYGSFAGTLAWWGIAGYDAYLETTGGTMHIALDKL